MRLDENDLREIRDLLKQEIDRTLARAHARGKRRPVVVMGEQVPEWRLNELRWQKIEYLLAIHKKCVLG